MASQQEEWVGMVDCTGWKWNGMQTCLQSPRTHSFPLTIQPLLMVKWQNPGADIRQAWEGSLP